MDSYHLPKMFANKEHKYLCLHKTTSTHQYKKIHAVNPHPKQLLIQITSNLELNNNINNKPTYKHIPGPHHMSHMAFEHKTLKHPPTHHHKWYFYSYMKQKSTKINSQRYIDMQFPSYKIIYKHTLDALTCIRCPYYSTPQQEED